MKLVASLTFHAPRLLMLMKSDLADQQAWRFRAMLAECAVQIELTQVGSLVSREMRALIAAALFRANSRGQVFSRVMVLAAAEHGGQYKRQTQPPS